MHKRPVAPRAGESAGDPRIIAAAMDAHGQCYSERVSELDRRGSSRTTFVLPSDADVPDRQAVPIDVIPYGSGVPDPENIPLDRDRRLDATGMEEAAACSIQVQVHPSLRRDFGSEISERVAKATQIATLAGHMVARSDRRIGAPGVPDRVEQPAAMRVGPNSPDADFLNPWPPGV